MIGKALSHYRIVEKIGVGGMGEVYRARDEHLARDVAIKVLPAGLLTDEAAHKRFRKEALALSKLNHPNIATVHDFDTQDGVDFLVMEYVPGVTLSDKLRSGPLPEEEVTRLGMQLAEGLEAAHKEKVIHRDIKPGNLRVTPERRLKILDFGLAKFVRPVDGTTTIEGTTESAPTEAMAGTLPYMAPEQVREEQVDTRTDIYSLGMVLYEMATGQRAFPDRQAGRLMDAILHQAPQPPSRLNRRVSPGLENVILKALDKEPENRYQSAKELVVDLRRSVAPTTEGTAEAAAGIRRRTVVLGTGIALVALLAVLVGFDVGGMRERLLGSPTPGRIESLAVLPLENLSGDPEQEYFVDGMTETLITELSKIGALKVISRQSVMQFKGTDKPLPQIARELNVDAVVEGSALHIGERVRITVQLIEAASDRNLWAENYDRELIDVLALHSEVARAIAREVRVMLTPQEQIRLGSARPVNPEAHEAYLKGRYFWNKRTPEGVKKGLAYFQQAIEEEPNYAMAHTGVADSYALHWWLPPKEANQKLKAAALKALEIDETLAEAHTSLAQGELSEWDWSSAEREFKRAIELNQNYATAHHWYSIYLTVMGRHEEAIAEARRAVELDPLSLIINTSLGGRHHYARQYDQAIEQYRKTLEMSPNFDYAHYALGQAYEQKGMYEESIAEFHRAIALSGNEAPYIAALGHAYAVSGKRSDAVKNLDKLEDLSKQIFVSPYEVASVYAALGKEEQAFEWLEKAYEEQDSFLYLLGVDPGVDNLRSASRFQDLLRRIGLPVQQNVWQVR